MEPKLTLLMKNLGLNLIPLEDFLSKRAPGFSIVNPSRDSTDFRAFVSSLFVHDDETLGAFPIPAEGRPKKSSSTMSLVREVAQRLANKGAENVLAAVSAVNWVPGVGGKFQRRVGDGLGSLSFFSHVRWAALHARLGDEAFALLLTDRSMFALAGGGTYLVQLTGKSTSRAISCRGRSARGRRRPARSRSSTTPAVKKPRLEVSVASANSGQKRKEEKLKLLKERRKAFRQSVASTTPRIPRYDGKKRLPRSSIMYATDLRERLCLFGRDRKAICDDSDAGEKLAVHVWFCPRLDAVGPLGDAHHPRCLYSKPSEKWEEKSLASINGLPEAVKKAFLAKVGPLCRSAMVNFKRLHVPSVLARFCPLPDDFRGWKWRALTDRVSSLHTPAVKVFLLVRFILLAVVPAEMWGSQETRRLFLRKLKRFVTMGRTDVMSLGYVMYGVKISGFDWTSSLTLSVAKEDAVAKFYWWVLSSLSCDILRSFFYVTEMDHRPRSLLFFRKNVWRRLRGVALNNYVLSENFQKLSPGVAEEKLAREESLGAASLRFVPKQKSLRPILRMKNSSDPNSDVNAKLADAFKFLKMSKSRRPSSIGVGIFGRSDFLKKYLSFRETADRRGRGVYFMVKIDVDDCYQTIDQKKLCRIIDGIGEYHSEMIMADQRFDYVTLTGNRPKVNRASVTILKKASEESPSFGELANLAHERDRFYAAIIEDRCFSGCKAETSQICRVLKDHITNTLIKVESDYYLMSRGLAAGCVVSSLCCNLYYGDLENTSPPAGDAENCLVVREIDDYLLIADRMETAQRFLTSFSRGFPEYSMYVKRSKTLTNFPFASRCYEAPALDSSCARVYPAVARSRDCRSTADSWFPWCGFLFDDRTLEVRFDFARYDWRRPRFMRQSISVSYGHRWSTKILVDAVKSNVKNLGWPLCFAPPVNSRRVRLRNFLEFLVLVLRKLYTLDRELRPFSSRLHCDPETFVDIVETISRVARSRIEAATRHALRKLGKSASRVIRRDAAIWLGYEAAAIAFHPNRGQFGRCLKAVRHRQRMYAASMRKDFQFIRSLSVL